MLYSKVDTTALSIMTLSIMCLFATLSLKDIQHYNTAINYNECLYAECSVYLIVILNVKMLSVIMLSTLGILLVLPRNIRLSWQVLPGQLSSL